jgi:plastocyanin
MLEQLWNSFLELTAQFILPDWGVVIGMLPVVIVLPVALILLVTFRRLLGAPPARRGVQRVEPVTPAGIHMPGPSLAPILAAVGLFLLFVGLVFGGVTLALGAIALTLTLLYWLAEGLHLYDRDVAATRTILPARVDTGPPPGVHMPGPSFRPLLGALGMALLFLGLVFGGWLLPVGVIALVTGLIGWLSDARGEYVKTVEADRTGHMENLPAPRWPSRLFATLAVLVVVAAIGQSGILTTGPANGGTPGSSPDSGESSAPTGSGAPSTPPDDGPVHDVCTNAMPDDGPVADATVEAKGIAFVQTSWTGPSGRPFTIAFVNSDAGTPHNIQLNDASGEAIWKGEIFNGVETRVYDAPALPAGEYPFSCSVHPNMTGTATLQ